MNRALLVGINAYPGGNELHGCINDVQDMANFLVTKCNFSHDDVRLLTDARATKTGICDRLGWLLSGLRAGDRVLFHYSGHGAQVPTRNPQGEVDGLDEVICPVDFNWEDAHMIKDKDFHRIFANIPAGVEFIWISDSCHSADLSREFSGAKPGEYRKIKTILPPADIDWRIKTAKAKGITPGSIGVKAAQLNLALISGCKSDQTSADAFINNRYNGALTYYLLHELNLAHGMTATLKKITANVNTALQKGHYTQSPQLEGSSTLMNRKFL